MTSYAWIGRTRTGRTVKGHRQAMSQEALRQALRREHILVTNVIVATRTPRATPVPAKSLAVFTRQLSVMIDAGVPLVQCLDHLARDEPHPSLADAIDGVRREIEGGASLADAMKERPHAFDPLFTSMVAAGEAGGMLDTIFARLAIFIEKRAKLMAQIQAAMLYPVVIIGVAVLVVGIILLKVIPTFSVLFAGLNAELPASTRAVIWMSEQLVLALPFIATAGSLVAYGFGRYRRTVDGRRRIDRVLLAVPLVGKILQKVAVARFCRTLSTLVAAGVPILRGLEITARTAGNVVIEQAVTDVRGRVERGETIARPLRASGVFPPLVSQMIGAGETTGALETMLGKIAEFYEDEVDAAVAALVTTLEPALICVLGLVVGGIVFSMYMPLFDLINQRT